MLLQYIHGRVYLHVDNLQCGSGIMTGDQETNIKINATNRGFKYVISNTVHKQMKQRLKRGLKEDKQAETHWRLFACSPRRDTYMLYFARTMCNKQTLLRTVAFVWEVTAFVVMSKCDSFQCLDTSSKVVKLLFTITIDILNSCPHVYTLLSVLWFTFFLLIIVMWTAELSFLTFSI